MFQGQNTILEFPHKLGCQTTYRNGREIECEWHSWPWTLGPVGKRTRITQCLEGWGSGTWLPVIGGVSRTRGSTETWRCLCLRWNGTLRARDVLLGTKQRPTQAAGGKPNKTRVPWGKPESCTGKHGVALPNSKAAFLLRPLHTESVECGTPRRLKLIEK